MSTIQLREAKAKLSRLVDAAEAGEPTIITRHGREAAMLVPMEEGRKLFPKAGKSFIEHLMAFPGGVEFERDTSTLRDVDFD